MSKKLNFFAAGVLIAQGRGINSPLFQSIGNTLFPGGGLAGNRTAGQLITGIVQLLLFFAGSIAVIFLIWGGFNYIMSRGNEEQAEKAKKTIQSSVIGLIVIILAFSIVYIVSNLVTGTTGV